MASPRSTPPPMQADAEELVLAPLDRLAQLGGRLLASPGGRRDVARGAAAAWRATGRRAAGDAVARLDGRVRPARGWSAGPTSPGGHRPGPPAGGRRRCGSDMARSPYQGGVATPRDGPAPTLGASRVDLTARRISLPAGSTDWIAAVGSTTTSRTAAALGLDPDRVPHRRIGGASTANTVRSPSGTSSIVAGEHRAGVELDVGGGERHAPAPAPAGTPGLQLAVDAHVAAPPPTLVDGDEQVDQLGGGIDLEVLPAARRAPRRRQPSPGRSRRPAGAARRRRRPHRPHTHASPIAAATAAATVRLTPPSRRGRSSAGGGCAR